MEELLEKIAHNTEPKESFQIVVNDKTRFVTKFNPHIQFKKNKSYEIALVNLETYYSFPNITTENNHFSYSPDGGGTWFQLRIPEGSYDIEDINEFIQQKMKQNGHGNSVTISANTNTLKAVLILENIPPKNLTYCVHARGGWKRVGFAKAVCLFKPLNGRSTYCVEITNRLK